MLNKKQNESVKKTKSVKIAMVAMAAVMLTGGVVPSITVEAASGSSTTAVPQTVTLNTFAADAKTETKTETKVKAVKATSKAFNRTTKAQDFKKSTNGDTVGWLYIPNTNIDYAIVQNKQSNEYYMSKGYDKKYSFNGVLWTDYRGYASSYVKGATFSKNTIIFGHNWKNVRKPLRTITNAIPEDVMFGLLPSYTYLDFAKKTPFIYYSTLDNNLCFQVFASFYTDSSFDYVYPDPDDKTYKTILETALSKSEHQYNVDVSTDDRILTLSTCTRVNGSSATQRYVVMAKRVPEGTASSKEIK